EPDEREPPAGRRGAAHDGLRESQHAVSERVGAIEKHQREQRYSGPDEGENPEQDGADTAQQQHPPVLCECVQQQTRDWWTSNMCHDRPPSVVRRPALSWAERAGQTCEGIGQCAIERPDTASAREQWADTLLPRRRRA